MEMSTSTDRDEDGDIHDEDQEESYRFQILSKPDTPLQNSDWINPEEICLTKAMAIKGISKVSMKRREFENVEKHLEKVVSLHLQKKGIQVMVPDALDDFYSLAHLYLYDNKIRKINGLLSCSHNLESLHLSGNQITRIEDLRNCVNLRRLYLGHNKIEVVEGLESLSMLLELHMEHQQLPPEQPLIFCPNSLDTISRKLKVLNVSGNQLESIEDLMCMDVLDTLNLSRNRLSDLDHATIMLRTLRQLRVVDLRENSITKHPKYRENIIGHLNRIEVLDGKDVNETQRCSIQRLCSIKASRMRNQMNKKSLSQSVMNEHSGFPKPPSAIHILKSISNFSDEINQSQQFQFSTPISSSPIPEQQLIKALNPLESITSKASSESGGDFINTVDQEFSKHDGSFQKEIKVLYASRTSTQLQDEETDSESMSEMAKIIFRLSNLSPSTDRSVGENNQKSKDSSYWKSYMTGGSSTVKESRPLSPLELDVTNASNSLPKALGSRKSAPLRRPMVRKLPPRYSVGAGRTLSPLQELPTPGPDSSRDGTLAPEWVGQSFQTSVCTLPPWPHITRRKAIGPPKVMFMP